MMRHPLTVYTGLPASGKTSTMIREMRHHQDTGGKVVLFLSSEHEELTRRPNVKPGGLMGSRTPGVYFQIDFVCDTVEAAQQLGKLEVGTLAAFDEAQFFRPNIVAAWNAATQRGVHIVLASPSQAQLAQLQQIPHQAIKIEVDCMCRQRKATRVIHKDHLVYPIHVCETCYHDQMHEEFSTLLAEVQTQDPFPGEKRTYQPFYRIDMTGWEFVRPDSQARLDIIVEAMERVSGFRDHSADPAAQPTYLDVGCCSGFFCDGLTTHGSRATGVDVTRHFISWAERRARTKGQSIHYVCADANTYLHETANTFDVISSFATIQWLMVQKGYQTGLNCLKAMFQKTRAMTIVEMGYTSEDIYKDKIHGLPREINKDWVLAIMQQYGEFAAIEVHPAGESGLKRDVFIGFKEAPLVHPFRHFSDSQTITPVSNARDHWEDRWVGPTFEVYLQAQADMHTLHIHGWRPEYTTTAAESLLSIGINGTFVGSSSVNRGSFAYTQNIPSGLVKKKDTFRLSIDCTTIEDIPEDQRNLSFILTQLRFS